MERQCLYRYRRSCTFSNVISFLFWKKSGAQLIWKILKISNKCCLLFPGRTLDNEQAANNCKHNSNGSGSHAKTHGVIPTHIFKRSANCSSSSVSAVKTCREHSSKCIVKSRPY